MSNEKTEISPLSADENFIVLSVIAVIVALAVRIIRKKNKLKIKEVIRNAKRIHSENSGTGEKTPDVSRK